MALASRQQLRLASSSALPLGAPSAGGAAPTFAAAGVGRPGPSREAVVVDLGCRPTGVIELAGDVFNVPVRVDILHRCVRYLRALWQQGTHKAKTRAEVRGGSRKPRPQKKTGRSRQGSIRSPIWVGGGAAFGPRPRSHAHALPRNVQAMGMRCALSARAGEGGLVIAAALASSSPAGRRDAAGGGGGRGARAAGAGALAASLQRLSGLGGGGGGGGGGTPAASLFVDMGEADPEGGRVLRAAAGRVSGASVMSVDTLTVYHVLRHRTVVMTAGAAAALEKSLLQRANRRKAPLRSAWFQQELSACAQAMGELQAAAISAAAHGSSRS